MQVAAVPGAVPTTPFSAAGGEKPPAPVEAKRNEGEAKPEETVTANAVPPADKVSPDTPRGTFLNIVA